MMANVSCKKYSGDDIVLLATYFREIKLKCLANRVITDGEIGNKFDLVSCCDQVIALLLREMSGENGVFQRSFREVPMFDVFFASDKSSTGMFTTTSSLKDKEYSYREKRGQVLT